jgi:pimeloyl-ACP methyl ester carboxylesterase
MASRFRRSHAFSVPAHLFTVTTNDGVRLVGSRLGDAAPAVVLIHGLMGWHRKPSVGRLAEALAARCTVYAFDLRGHGGSGGRCTFGDREIEDIAAVVARARDEGHEPVVTVGASMGGIAAIRHAALIGGVDGLVAISTPARWEGHRGDAIRRMTWLTSTPNGRRVAGLFNLRLVDTWEAPASPEEVVDRIAPIPLVLVHGRDDHFFEEEEAWRLYRRAGEPKKLLLASRFGHAEDGFSPGFAERLLQEVAAMVPGGGQAA